MSSTRRTKNNRFRNPEARKHLAFADFVELLAELFPDRELMAKSVTLADGEIVKGCVLKGSKAEEDFRWAGEFYRATNEAFLSAAMWETLKKRQADELVADRLSDIAKGDEADERAGLDVIDAVIKGGPEPSDEDHRLLSLLDTVDGALKELLRIQEQLSEVIEWQAERRAQLIEAAKG